LFYLYILKKQQVITMAETEETKAAAAATTTEEPAAAEAKSTTKNVVIAYYSRTGTTKIAVEALAEKLKAKGVDAELLPVIVDKSNEGYIYSAFQAFRGKNLEVKEETTKIGGDATEVWLCGPVHCWTICAALKQFIETNLEALKSDKVTINAVATMGGSGDAGFYKVIEETLGKKISKRIAFLQSAVKDPAKLSSMLDDFLNPKPEDPKAEEPKAEEPKAEEPKAEEPKAEEPKAEEPKAEEPKAE